MFRNYLVFMFLFFLVAMSVACNKEEPLLEEPIGCDSPLCDPTQIAALGFDPFYKKILDADGIPVISSELVADEALLIAREVILAMLAKRPDVRDAMIQNNARVGIMDDTEVTTDIPEHRYLSNDPNTDWDTRARGLGGTPQNPITTTGEENLLCFTSDVYSGENILVHEFAHAIHLMGIKFVEPDFEDHLEQIFQNAIAQGLWNNTYAQTNRSEYWAEGVQSWFNTNQMPQTGIHNEIDTRTELKSFDPDLYDLIARYVPDSDWKAPCE